MIQRIRHIVHIVLSTINDYISLLWRPLFYQLQYQHFRNEIEYNGEKNKLCILGNGPSCSFINEHLDQLKDFDFCCVNHSINTKSFYRIKPKMFVMVDMILWMRKDDPKIKQIWDSYKDIDWDITFFFPFNFPKYVKKHFEQNPHIKVCHYANNPWEPESRSAKRLRCWLYKKGWVSPNGSNVSLAAIYSALLSGYKDINLLGVEHSWMRDIRVNDKNEVVLIDKHYYGTTEHVWLDYEGRPIKLVDFLSSQLCTFTGHMNLREFADFLDVKIINRTKGSYIDAYEKRPLEEIIH